MPIFMKQQEETRTWQTFPPFIARSCGFDFGEILPLNTQCSLWFFLRAVVLVFL